LGWTVHAWIHSPQDQPAPHHAKHDCPYPCLNPVNLQASYRLWFYGNLDLLSRADE
jgi:hypothetical protein